MIEKLAVAIAIRKDKKGKETIIILKNLLLEYPKDPDVNYQMALTYEWTCRRQGRCIFRFG